MPVPKRKRSRARRDKRFANKGIKESSATQCSQCEHPLVSHQACSKCGFYKGKKVMATKKDRGLKRQEQQAKKKVKKEADTSQELE